MESQNHSGRQIASLVMNSSKYLADPELEFAIGGTLYALGMRKTRGDCEFCQLIWTRLDFKALFGKSVFESALAEIIRREHNGTPSFSLLVRASTQNCTFEPRLTFKKDVLRGVNSLYAGAVTKTLNMNVTSRSGYMDLYRYIYHVRCCSESTEWEAFFQRLLLYIASSCKTLQQNNAPVPRSTRPTQFDQDLGYLGQAQTGRANSQSPSQYASESSSPPETPISSSSLQSVSHVPPIPVNSSNATELPKYTMALKEHVDIEGGRLEYVYKNLSLTPSVWRCVASWDGTSAYATGQNKLEAKHTASQRMCQSLGLDIDSTRL